MKVKIGISDLKYFGTNKDRYQIEIPMSLCHKVPSDWVTKSQKKTHRRYWNKFIESKLYDLTHAEERLISAQKDTLRSVFEKFDQSRNLWSDGISCISLIDALLSLSVVSSFPGYCRPNVFESSRDNLFEPVLDIVGGRHPMLEYRLLQRGEGDCIANDLRLGGTRDISESEQLIPFHPKMLLLSGPNMGGKSTLLRQTCLIVILAQMGCWVPADSCNLTPVDRIYTRVGASDRILAGQSTFFVELAETATILNTATKNSLCILDELGRGTATFDGTAIAHAVVEHLVSLKHCRVLFATHYHSLVKDWEVDPRVQLGHMDCLVHTHSNDDTTTGEKRDHSEEVTFLYKLSEGCSPRSYGINVARLAGLPQAVITLALQQSRIFEEQMNSLSAVAATSNNLVSNHSFISNIFERLCSLAHSTSNVEELSYAAMEMWNKLQ